MDDADQLVAEARERRQRQPDTRELRVTAISAALFLVAAVAIAIVVPPNRDFDPLLMVALVVAQAAFSRVRFEYGESYVSAEQLVFVAMVMLLPLNWVPLLACAAGLLAAAPELLKGEWHRRRLLSPISESWFSVGPVLVLAWLAPGDPALEHSWVYALAFVGELLFDHGGSLIRERWLARVDWRAAIHSSLASAQVDAILSPVAFVVTLVAFDQPAVLLVFGPMVWLLLVFSRDRRARYTATLELNRAYRGTVMLLADVVEFEDDYTADHSRSVVELVQTVAAELDVDTNQRQEMEFAALLHDVGKISIPKEILNKPAKLNDTEFEIMKTHTIEGQFMLDRVGGLLGRVGQIVRSCHERWDGNGYPDGLAGEEIPLAARIVFVCDAFNAMTTDRPYRRGMPTEAAIAELVANAGTQFDPVVVDALIATLGTGEPEDAAREEMRALLAGVRPPEGVTAS
jgi:HD-GYP domain-containing protein (c-di-GMP phosphodiesterase class II)